MGHFGISKEAWLYMKKDKIPRIIKISLITLLGIILTLCIAGYFIIHTYINKMNLVSDNVGNDITEMKDITNNVNDIDQEEETDEMLLEGSPEITDSPQKDIDNLERPYSKILRKTLRI
jgi:hypothetical protein